MTPPKKVWRGAAALRRFLVPLEDLEPFPGNARRGDVEAVRQSLERFGQVRPITTDADGRRIVAGHHVVLAAIEEGWTHVAAIPNEFADGDEALAYNVADNGTHEAGSYDLELLYAQLAAVQGRGLQGTGYSDRYLSDLEQQLAALRAPPPDEFPPLRPEDLDVPFRCPSCHYEWSGDPRPGDE